MTFKPGLLDRLREVGPTNAEELRFPGLVPGLVCGRRGLESGAKVVF